MHENQEDTMAQCYAVWVQSALKTVSSQCVYICHSVPDDLRSGMLLKWINLAESPILDCDHLEKVNRLFGFDGRE